MFWQLLKELPIYFWNNVQVECEHKFHNCRKWRFDAAFPTRMVAVEFEGGIWIRGRHQRPTGFRKDCEKYNAAVALGWRVFRLCDGMDVAVFVEQVEAALLEGSAK